MGQPNPFIEWVRLTNDPLTINPFGLWVGLTRLTHFDTPRQAQWCHTAKKNIIFKLLVFFKKSKRYIFFQNTRSIFKNKSIEIKILSYKKNWAFFLFLILKYNYF